MTSQGIWWRARALFGRERFGRELRDEMRFHHEMLVEQYVRDGMSAADAADAAKRRIGNTTYVAEESRMVWGIPALDSVTQDVRYAFRSLRASPAFTLAAAFTLALGIGATTAIFSVVDGVLLRPLPYAGSDRLITLHTSPPGQRNQTPPSLPDFRDWKAQNTVFEQVVYTYGDAVMITGKDGAERMTLSTITDGFFPMMGVRPLLGRTLTADDERPGAERALVIGHQLWVERYGADPSIIGQKVSTDLGGFTIVGVMPPSFRWPDWAQAWSSFAASPFPHTKLENRGFRVDARVLAKLKPGVSQARMQTELDAIGKRLAAEYPDTDKDLGIFAMPLLDQQTGDLKRPLYTLLGAVAGLLLIACANVGNLSLARSGARQREVGVRMAIGASRWRIVRQLLVESLVLATIGGVLGLLVAKLALVGLLRLAPQDLPRLQEIGIDVRTVAFAAGICMLSAILFGIAPAFHVSSGNLVGAVREGGRGSGRGRQSARLRTGFVVAEIALASALVIGSSLLLKSFSRMRGADVGFEPEHLLTVRLEPSQLKYDSQDRMLALYRQVAEQVQRIPGVERASFINHLQVSRAGVVTDVDVEGVKSAPGQTPNAMYRLVDSAYFRVAGQRVVRGRGFTPADMTPASTAIIINEALAKQLFDKGDPIGRRITVYKQLGGTEDFRQPVAGQVVGVVADVQDYDLTASAYWEVYLPFTVNPWRSAYLVARTKGDPALVVPAVQRVLASIDPNLPVKNTMPVRRMMSDQLARRRFNTTMLSVFGATALLLATLGIYGIIAYSVSQRTQEIGVRAALGAQPRDLISLFVRGGLGLALGGAALGMVLASALGRTIQSLLFGVTAMDWATFAQVSFVVLAVAGLASWLPARRATRVDPVTAMRAD